MSHILSAADRLANSYPVPISMRHLNAVALYRPGNQSSSQTFGRIYKLAYLNHKEYFILFVITGDVTFNFIFVMMLGSGLGVLWHMFHQLMRKVI